MNVAIESIYSHWIDERGYNFEGAGTLLTIGQSYNDAGSQRVYRQINAFSIFSSIPNEEILSGSLQVLTGNYLSDQPGEMINIFGMSTPVEFLYGSHTFGNFMPEIFDDAQSGVLLASYYREDRSPGISQFVDIPITANGIAWFNGLEDNAAFAIGYTVTDIKDDDYVLLSFYDSPGGIVPTLQLEVVPEPGTLTLLFLTASLAAFLQRHRG